MCGTFSHGVYGEVEASAISSAFVFRNVVNAREVYTSTNCCVMPKQKRYEYENEPMVNGYGVRVYVNLTRAEIFRRARRKWQAKCPQYCNAISSTVEHALGGWPCGWKCPRKRRRIE